MATNPISLLMRFWILGRGGRLKTKYYACMIRMYALKIVCFAFVLAVSSCDNRKIVYSGFNDLVVGIQSLILYDNKTFYIELGLGGVAGNYKIVGDTIKLKYYDKPNSNFPDIMLIRKNYFISTHSPSDTKKYVKFLRNK